MSKVKVGGIYKHFKGNFYRVLSIAKHSETREDVVVYKRLHGYTVYVRPLSMFTSDVDSSKYPNVKQKERFQYCECSYEDYMDTLYKLLPGFELDNYKLGEELNYRYLECDEPKCDLTSKYHINDDTFHELAKFSNDYNESWLRAPSNPLSLYRTSLSMRVIYNLRRGSIETLCDLLHTDLDKIARLKNIGSSALREIKQVIDLYQDDANITLERKLYD